jgi:hypothetical protein
MVALLLCLLLIALLFGAGTAYSALYLLAVFMLVIWLLGFVVRPSDGRGRWYYW